MDKEGIPRLHIPVNGPKRDRISKIPDKKLMAMDSKEVARLVGCTVSWAIVCLRRQGRLYKKHRVS